MDGHAFTAVAYLFLPQHMRTWTHCFALIIAVAYLFLPKQMRTRAHGFALVWLLQQLSTVASGLVHQNVSVLCGEDPTLVECAHNALQGCDLCLAVWNGFFIQNEALRAWRKLCSSDTPREYRVLSFSAVH